MIDGNHGLSIEREIHLKKVKRALDNYRELSLLVNSWLLWKKSYYPWITMFVITTVFVEIFKNDPTFLSSVGIILLLATILDYGGPFVCSLIWKQEDWTSLKEREFEDMCRSIAGFIVQIKQFWNAAMDVKATRPYVYFSFTILSSLFLAMVGNSVDNVLILYIICLIIFLLPGLIHHGILKKYYTIALFHLANILKSFNPSTRRAKVQ